MDWGNFDPTHSLSVLNNIYAAQLSRHAPFDENTMMQIRLGAAAMHLWGTSRLPNAIRVLLPVDGVDYSNEARTLLFYGLDRERLRDMRESGIRRVQILGSDREGVCSVCRAAAGKTYPISKAPSLPHERCTCETGCTCMLVADE
jgi:hypothetical protein